jgi:PiT family inorganic phosphate transporter
MIDDQLIFVSFIILVALVFDFTNGAHDAANSVATIVSTKVLTLGQALFFAAFFNFIAFAIFGTAVAKTVGSGLVNLSIVTPSVIFAGLLGAILWNLLTLFLALPTSSSHALIGGYAGAATAKAGFGAILYAGWLKTLVFILVAPLLGFALSAFFLILSSWILYWRRILPSTVKTWSAKLQLVSAGFYSLGHGSNDAQKTIGIITGLLFSAGYISHFAIPFWVVIMAYVTIALGTLYGGRRIIKTMGQKIFRLRPIDGVCAESASATSIFLATFLGVPVSTTHVIAGAISGVGAVEHASAVKWDVALRIVWAWVFTIPAAAIFAGVLFLAGSLFVG